MSSSIEGATVHIQEEDPNTKTGGHFRRHGVTCAIAAVSTPQIFDVVWPIPVAAMAASVEVAEDWVGDIVDTHAAPDTIIGVSDASDIGDTVFTVSDTAIDALTVDPTDANEDKKFHLGYMIGIGGESLGQLIDVDPVNLTITTENAATQAHTANSLCKLTICMGVNMRFSAFNVVKSIGESKIGGSYIPAGKAFRLIYINKSSPLRTKEFHLELEILY